MARLKRGIGTWIGENHRVVSAVAAVATPVVVGVFGYFINQSVQGAARETEAFRLAVEILQAGTDSELRDWAVDVVEMTSPIPMDSALLARLRSGEIMIPNQQLQRLGLNQLAWELRLEIIRRTREYPVADYLDFYITDDGHFTGLIYPESKVVPPEPAYNEGFYFSVPIDVSRSDNRDYVQHVVSRAVADIKAKLWARGYVTPP